MDSHFFFTYYQPLYVTGTLSFLCIIPLNIGRRMIHGIWIIILMRKNIEYYNNFKNSDFTHMKLFNFIL